jgi:hypothetical protein
MVACTRTDLVHWFEKRRVAERRFIPSNAAKKLSEEIVFDAHITDFMPSLPGVKKNV